MQRDSKLIQGQMEAEFPAVPQREPAGAVTFRQATDAASLCKAIVTETAVSIQGRRYVRVEGWQAIAVAHGCVASARGVERIQGGVRAVGEVKRGSDGMVLATAEGFVGDDEATWGKREEYAKRAMAQTRAISRACRSAFAHVVVMMRAGLETTPAEEVPVGGFADGGHQLAPPAKPAAPAQPAPTPPDRQQASGRHEPEDAVQTAVVTLGDVREKSGRGKHGDWTRFYTRADDGEYYSTFDATMAECMKELSNLGDPVRMHYRVRVTPRGNSRDIEDIEIIQPAEPGPGNDAADNAADEAAAEAAGEQQAAAKEEMPF